MFILRNRILPKRSANDNPVTIMCVRCEHPYIIVAREIARNFKGVSNGRIKSQAGMWRHSPQKLIHHTCIITCVILTIVKFNTLFLLYSN